MSLNIGNNIKTVQAGFTLIELAVVLVIIGILVSGFIGTLSSRIDTSRQIETTEALKSIKVSLYGFAMAKLNPLGVARLPCPDIDNDGLEDFNPLNLAQCAVLTTYGNLPWATLGIERGDAWSSTYSYWVANEYSSTAGFTLATDASGTGQIRAATPAGNVISSNVAAVIFSHGKNQYGSIGMDNSVRAGVPANTPGSSYDDERENQDTDAAAPVLFISRSVTGDDAPIVYDDILTWISEYELKGRMAQAGALP